MNRPYWLDSVYILVWMLPPVLVAFVVSKMTGLSGIVGLAVFLGIGLVAIFLWLALLVLWSRLFKSES
ncbi:hypothetical protein C5Y96_00775 [Blastopirellula marina]|uniref:Uncharacterized protein n=1 Tax=Blastopirellula marina TaxID=124 RepID=A0A2S8G9Z4_9BACT|nr:MULTISPECIES: hypothetical protein [Pirellulaceae]PQO41278.1 hypothetical protein C5Y96_00775 [Blastopirellula marina]RCS56302.1 hypothetical protein DTL36_00775 [Bremerella cremea]